jgi:hypothetical protein
MGFRLRSSGPFKMMGSSPARQTTTDDMKSPARQTTTDKRNSWR